MGMMARKKRIKRVSATLALLAGFAACGSASAQSLRELRSKEQEERALAREIQFTGSVCGTSISARIDWRSAANWPENVSIAAVCDSALGAVEAMCRSDEGKRGAAKIKQFVCAGDGSGASLNGATLRYGATPGVNGFASTRSVLERAF